MENKINLSPLQELLTIMITPQELAKQLDEMAYFYAQTIIRLQKYESDGMNLHEDADIFVYRLKQLRDTLLMCNK